MARNKRKILSPNEPILHPDHKRPVTRRDFLNAGFITSAASVIMPGLITSMMSKKALAAFSQERDCGIGGTAAGDKVPFICVDLGGGANMAGSNVLIGGQGGQLDLLGAAAYNKMGLPNNMSPITDPGMVNTDLGLAFHADSAFLRGIFSKTSAACRLNVNGAVIPAASDNDTQNNPHNPMYGIARAGAVGSLATLIGTQNSDSGGRSVAPADMIDLTVRPTKISSANDARGLIDTGAVSSLMPDRFEAGRVMEAAENISLAKINGSTTDSVPDLPDDPTPVTSPQDLVHCGYRRTTHTVSSFDGPSMVDPASDPLMRGGADPAPITNRTNDLNVIGTAVTDQTAIFTEAEVNGGRLASTAAVAKLVIDQNAEKRFAGAGTIALGGYDYHNGTRATGEMRDFEAGQAIGAILEYAHRKNKRVMVYVFTDGSLGSNGRIDNDLDGRGKGEWTGDNSSTSAAFFLVYGPVGRPQLLTSANQTAAQHQQLGWMRASGSVETNASTPGANNPNLLAEMCILNWMALNGDAGLFANPEYFPNHGLGSQLDRWIAFAPVPAV